MADVPNVLHRQSADARPVFPFVIGRNIAERDKGRFDVHEIVSRFRTGRIREPIIKIDIRRFIRDPQRQLRQLSREIRHRVRAVRGGAGLSGRNPQSVLFGLVQGRPNADESQRDNQKLPSEQAEHRSVRLKRLPQLRIIQAAPLRAEPGAEKEQFAFASFFAPVAQEQAADDEKAQTHERDGERFRSDQVKDTVHFPSHFFAKSRLLQFSGGGKHKSRQTKHVQTREACRE